ncbi:hypothetical protein BASA62_007607 [Batrachochytrium salamandrivorans]|nr:hypothetical protein BASA62_007607 [Batrachochytrium salamandrivorans]
MARNTLTWNPTALLQRRSLGLSLTPILILLDEHKDVHEVALFVTLYSHLLSVHGPVIFTHMWVPSQTGTGTFGPWFDGHGDSFQSAIRHSKETRAPEKMTEAIVGVMGRRRGLPVGVQRLLRSFWKCQFARLTYNDIYDDLLGAQWFNVLGMVQCAHDTIDFWGNSRKSMRGRSSNIKNEI